ncbi:putative development/cell death domain, kelch-type beta propeller, galactose oxidase, beta-propeller [Lupinus albus]|uniref:Putative development/cell death domain, kelch-type beta propeller, galactose oxidase, beta-propeller n=1 Tax=Lupinus albus TaxID=3870 RepID=A0A6A4QUZ6_LUPAL|nr:putative development/cell death domain, kelch-type beta propeller, galactose oxidase, beta-propeller [Lupinus albus]
MGTGRKTQTSHSSGTQSFTPNSVGSSVCGRNLRKNQLGGVIFGTNNTTIKECLSKQLFGLPVQHFSYVKNIDPGLPLFLFNYSDRKLHGIFEAASSGKMFIDPYGWTEGGSARTQYPAQVQIHVRLECQPLSEDKFRGIIQDNYYTQKHFWFELDHAQTNKLIALLSSLAIVPGNSGPRNIPKWTTISQYLPLHETPRQGEASKTVESEIQQSAHSSMRSDSTENVSSLDGDIQTLDTHVALKEAKQDYKDLIFTKLKELSLHLETQKPSLPDKVSDIPDSNTVCFVEKSTLEAQAGLEKKEENPSTPSEYQYNISQLVQKVKELISFKKIQIEWNNYLEQKLMEAEMEIQYLKDRCKQLESARNIPVSHVEKIFMKSSTELHLDPKDSLFLIGGFNGESWFKTMDMYSTSQKAIKSLKPMSSVRSYSSAVQLNGEIYVFGGGNGHVWYDTVESYNPIDDNWTLWPSLSQKKGSLSGAALHGKIYAVGGGNGIECFSDVEMFDFEIGQWILTRSMLDTRFAPAAVEFNGALYATGGYDGNDYLNSAERLDPREHSWTKIPNMNIKRGCHSLVVLNEKLYALGGFDGIEMVSSVDVFDPRLGAWIMGEPMNHARGYCAAAVVKESIYVFGGVKVGETIVDTVEKYKEGEGWHEILTSEAVKRCFLSAIACE